MTKLIHPKIGTVREVDESNHNKIAILTRAGFIPFSKYRAPKKKEVIPEPTVSDVVQDNKLDAVDQSADTEAVIAIHASGAARKLIADNDLDASLIKGSGKDGQITKPDVTAYLESKEEAQPDSGVEDENAVEAVLEAPGDELGELEAEIAEDFEIGEEEAE